MFICHLSPSRNLPASHSTVKVAKRIVAKQIKAHLAEQSGASIAVGLPSRSLYWNDAVESHLTVRHYWRRWLSEGDITSLLRMSAIDSMDLKIPLHCLEVSFGVSWQTLSGSARSSQSVAFGGNLVAVASEIAMWRSASICARSIAVRALPCRLQSNRSHPCLCWWSTDLH